MLMKQSEEDKMNNVYDEYVSYMKQYPDDIEDSVWSFIQKKQRRKVITIFSVGIAASLLLAVSIFSVSRQNEKKNMEMQFAIIEKALNHASSELTNEDAQRVEVLYEDEIITIVAENVNAE